MVFRVRDFSTSSPLYRSASTEALVSFAKGFKPSAAPLPVSQISTQLLQSVAQHPMYLLSRFCCPPFQCSVVCKYTKTSEGLTFIGLARSSAGVGELLFKLLPEGLILLCEQCDGCARLARSARPAHSVHVRLHANYTSQGGASDTNAHMDTARQQQLAWITSAALNLIQINI